MKKRTGILIILLIAAEMLLAQRWTTHLAYNDIRQVLVTPEEVYVLSGNNFFSINKQTEQKYYYSLQDGLSSSMVAYLAYDSINQALMIFYENGYLDLRSKNGIATVSDLYMKQMTQSKSVRSATRRGDLMYLAMPYGIQTYNLRSRTFVDTYYIADEAADLNINRITLAQHHIYAAADSSIYVAHLDSNIVDYRQWKKLPTPANTQVNGIAEANGSLYAVWGNTLYKWANNAWTAYPNYTMSSVSDESGRAIAVLSAGFIDMEQSGMTILDDGVNYQIVSYDPAHQDYWGGSNSAGVIHHALTGNTLYSINSPAVNLPYQMKYIGKKLMVVQGGRWAAQYWRSAYIMSYENGVWSNIAPQRLNSQLPYTFYDLMDVAGDESEPNHYYVSSYGGGLLEMQGDTVLHSYNSDSCLLVDASAVDPQHYTRLAGMYMDEQGNLWMTNSTSGGMIVKTKSGAWYKLEVQDDDGQVVPFHSPGLVKRDPVKPYRIWIESVRSAPGIGMIDYNGTVETTADDRSMFRNQFVDENNTSLELGAFYGFDIAPDGKVWLATEKGLFYISEGTDFRTNNTLMRPGIMAGDADLFLKDEPVNCVVIDSLNRKWIGTKNLGVYVLSADMSQVEYHFTTANSSLPANTILSIAIHPTTQEVMIGTGSGIAAFDENYTPSGLNSEPWEDMLTDDYTGMMNGWTYHFAYGKTEEVAAVGEMVYGLSDGALFSINTESEEVRTISQLSGLSGSGIGHIMSADGRLIIAYKDGRFDLIRQDGSIRTLTELRDKQINGVSKLMKDAVVHEGKIYMATDFGVLLLNIRKEEFADWYQPLQDAYPYLEHIQIVGDSIFAASATTLYSASLKNNLADFNYWTKQAVAERPEVVIGTHFLKQVEVGNCTYTAAQGIERVCGGEHTTFKANGPSVNQPYSIDFAGDKGIVVPGGRWASSYDQPAYVMTIENGQWSNIEYDYLCSKAADGLARDFTRTAFDPKDNNHYYISSFGTGLYEFQGNEVVNVYTEKNSPIRSVVSGNPYFQRIDGVTTDADGNVWVVNADMLNGVLVKSPSNQWAQLSIKSGGSKTTLATPGDILIDATRTNYKWIVSSRSPGGLALLDDGGTPFDASDDRSVMRTSLTDTQSKTSSLDAVRCIAQDRNGNIWLGTNEGPRVILQSTDFFKSDKCYRPIINRTDGSGLGDYLLGTERINCIAVDGGNRIWFGTQASGAYLMKIDMSDGGDKETIYHFTSKNSPLPDDAILSIGICPTTGEVYFGTESGLVSFRSDASEPKDNYNSAYAYPSPIRPDFTGVLTVTGLMEDSEVRITDAAGALVFKGTANGGTCTWNLRDGNGRRVKTGVYMIMCNSKAGEEPAGHTIVKVLVM